MSWYLSSIGTPANVAAHIATQVEQQCAMSHNSEQAKAVLRASGEVAKAFCAQAPQAAFVKVNLSGHLDQHTGNTTVQIETLTNVAPEVLPAADPPASD